MANIKPKLQTMWNPLNSICSNGSVWVMSTLYLTDTSTLVLSAQHKRPGVLVAVECINYLSLLLFHLRRAFIDIAATVQKFKNIIPELLPAHALSGCDTVAMCHGIGKGRMLKAVKTGKCSLSLLGYVNADMNEITKQATAFLCMCYNMPNEATMTEARIKVWLSKTGRKSASKVPKLCIVETLVSDEVIQEGCKSKLVITGQDYTPIEIAQNGLVIRRQDLKTTLEEADTIIVAQTIYAAKEERKNVVVVADDTDVYILLLYYYHAESLAIPMND